MKSTIEQLVTTANETYPQASEKDIKHMLHVFALSYKMFHSEAIAFRTAITTLKNKYNPSPVMEVVGIDVNKDCEMVKCYALRHI